MTRPQKLLGLALAWSWPGAFATAYMPLDEAVLGDDECAAGGDCAFNALQLRAASADDPAGPLIAEADPSWDDPAELGGEASDDLGTSVEGGYCSMLPNAKRCALYQKCRGRSYCIFGGYMVVPGEATAGMESINSGNAHHYDYLMGIARSHCGSPSCVLLTNPMGHRTQDQLHIHFRHFNGLGPSMHSKLMAATCQADGWVTFRTGCCGCGYSRARAFHGFPRVFTEAARAVGGTLAGFGVSVWFGCGKTVVLATSMCSIEHSVSAR